MHFDTLHLLSRQPTVLESNPSLSHPNKNSLDLILADGRYACEECLAGAKSLLRHGGRIGLLTDARDATRLAEAMEKASYKQIRFSQIPDPSLPGRRLVLLTAVRGGGSTFNDVYNNGAFPRPDAANDRGIPSDPRRHLLSETISICTDPGASIGATMELLQELEDLPVRHRTKPEKPATRTQ